MDIEVADHKSIMQSKDYTYKWVFFVFYYFIEYGLKYA